MGNIKTFTLVFLATLVSSIAIAENDCHKKPPGQCEKCCQLSNEAGFLKAASASCVRLKGEENVKASLFDQEVTTYLTTSKGELQELDPQLFRSFLKKNCSFETGTLRRAGIELGFSDCANGCPPPLKRSEKPKKKVDTK